MTTYAVTGATGQLGRLVVEELLARGTTPADVVAVVRSPGKASDLAAQGVTVREGDYDRPETLGSALAGVDALLLISGSEVGQRERQHSAVIDAAVAAGVGRIVYTSVLRADTTDLPVAPEHVVTEELLRASGLPTTVLRNGWYTENYASVIDQARTTGVVASATGGAPIAAAACADYAAATAAALLDPSTVGRTFELGGTPFTYDDLAAALAEVLGRPVRHQAVSADDLTAGLRAAGLDEGLVGFLVAIDTATATGALDTDPAPLAELAGRPSTPLGDVLRALVQG